MKIFLICGARPNFMKIAPLLFELKKFPDKFSPVIIHTGQHYDFELSRAFFQDLELPEPDIYLGVGSGTHGLQTGKIIIELEKVILKYRPDLIIVVGDVNSTLAGAIVASKLLIPLVHVEAGLRSFDRTMPEEINRTVTDILSDYLFTTEEAGNKNLLREGIGENKIYFCGDIMIDALIKNRDKAKNSRILKDLGLPKKEYAILTLHRPSNVDSKNSFSNILNALKEIGKRIKIVFPIHPRTTKMAKKFNLSLNIDGLILTKPLSYLDFLCLEENCKFALSDSGSIQGETTFFNIPCLTLRNNTERPITIKMGTNKLVGNDKNKIIEESFKILDGKGKTGKIPPFWDGRTAKRIVKVFLEKS